MSLTLRRILAAFLALWSLTVLLADSGLGWALLVLAGAWLLWRRPTTTAAAPALQPQRTPPAGRQARRGSSPDPMPYWILPTAAVAAASLHQREPVTTDSEEPAEDDELCDESYETAGAADAGWDDLDDPAADVGFGGFGGGGGWGDSADFGGSAGGGVWGGGDDFGGFGGGGDWVDGGDW